MEIEMKHFSHEHPLILKAEERKIDDGTNNSDIIIKTCDGCLTPISGPFYGCGECGYFLHKVCAELPNQMNHPMHPQHPLTLLLRAPYLSGGFLCDMCRVGGKRFVYNCSSCKFDVDPICASASHTIEDKCHQHPLIPLQLLISFPCHICRTEVKGLSYKCNICPFWVHQNCTVYLPSTVKHSDHDHLLTLLQSVPPEFETVSRKCDICHNHLSTFHCVYYCARCMFFSHASCARSKETHQSPRPRDQNIDINQDAQSDGQRLVALPVQQQSTDLISWFSENYGIQDRDANTNLISRFADNFSIRDGDAITNSKSWFAKTYRIRDQDAITNLISWFANNFSIRDGIDPDTDDKKQEIKFFYHEHPLFQIDDQVSEKICDACAQPILNASYGCIECGYFLHKCCTELPKRIPHPAHTQHQISLLPCYGFVRCDCCYQWSNGFVYNCLQCRFQIDIKCASLLRPVMHETHKHPLSPRFNLSSTCSACGFTRLSKCLLKCNTCSFNLCFVCAMAPPNMIHRYDEHPFKLTYSPPENHYNEYICELCLKELNPKLWHYHCHDCDQFTHVDCMILRTADSNIKYGKTYKFDDHEHRLTLVRCTYDWFPCSYCGLPLRHNFSVGLECKPCRFRIHLQCTKDYVNFRLRN